MVAGEEVVESAVEAPAKVVNLMDALRKSLDAVGRNKDLDEVSASKKKPVKAPRKRASRAAAGAGPAGARTAEAPVRRRKRA